MTEVDLRPPGRSRHPLLPLESGSGARR